MGEINACFYMNIIVDVCHLSYVWSCYALLSLCDNMWCNVNSHPGTQLFAYLHFYIPRQSQAYYAYVVYVQVCTLALNPKVPACVCCAVRAVCVCERLRVHYM